MENKTRRRNQERWMSGEARVLVGTLAFGLGINKEDVRAVIHPALPKSLEQFYQEAGRAGRDGQPADCILLWQKRDAGLLAHFIGQVEDGEEKQRAWERYHEIRRFVEASSCRHRQICAHFGEKTKWESCHACDVCGCDLAWLSEAPKSEHAKAHSVPAHAEPAHKRSSKAGKAAVAASDRTQVDPELREFLREWRRTTAKRQSVPAYVVMHDSSLDDLCRKLPRSLSEVRQVFGFGERRTEMYGPQILEALREFRKETRAAHHAND
jgi:ATP-dependent DNA helicase RecQ